MEPLPVWPMGDADDVSAYVVAAVKRVRPDADDYEWDELVGDGLVYAVAVWRKLKPGASMKQALAAGLDNHLRDCWRKRHVLCNSATGTYRPVPGATGLSHEYGDEPARALGIGGDPADIVLARDYFKYLESPTQLHDENFVGRLFGVPSHRAVPSAQVMEIFETAMAERDDDSGDERERFDASGFRL
jgi:hypothetical protein